jgi:hypothetical protein
MYAKASGTQFAQGPGMPKLEFDGMPTIPVEFVSSERSAGLELVDVMLWIHRRLDEKKPVADALVPLVMFNAPKGETNELSLMGLWHRWAPELGSAPSVENVPPERVAEVRELMARDDARVRAALEACAERPL